MVAVNEKPFQQAAEYVRPRGTVVAVGLPAGAYLRAPVFETVIKMITIKGSYVGNRKDTQEVRNPCYQRNFHFKTTLKSDKLQALDFFRRGLINAPIKVVGMSELNSVYDMMHEGKIVGRYVVDTSK